MYKHASKFMNRHASRPWAIAVKKRSGGKSRRYSEPVEPVKPAVKPAEAAKAAWAAWEAALEAALREGEK
jgi:hypothetical protein